MALDLLKDKGTPLERQRFTWPELVQVPYSKLNDDAFSIVSRMKRRSSIALSWSAGGSALCSGWSGLEEGIDSSMGGAGDSVKYFVPQS